MTSLEGAALKLGSAIATHAARSWLHRRRAGFERGAGLAELAEAELKSPLQRRKLDNLVDRIGNQVAEHLEPLLTQRFGDLPDNEATAAILAVRDVLAAADLSDEALLADDADPEQLARRLRTQFPDRPRAVSLAERARPLYELALDQSCRHLVQVVRHLPAFQPKALAELLGRLSAQAEQLDELLAHLPRTSLHAPAGTDRDAEFRAEYLRCLAKRLDRLELIGLPMDEQPTLALTVAYLSLSVSAEPGGPRLRRRSGGHLADEWFDQLAVPRQAEGVPVEAAIGDSTRTLLRGDAGSGKTTLLDWLAVTAARNGFTGALSDWNGCVPLPVRLRSFATGPLPAPEDLVPHAAKPVAGLMPEGWTHRLLRDGRALLLVDGVDEVPVARRRDVKDWLRGLVDAFPATRVVVTARTAAADHRWLAAEEFQTVTLEPMSPGSVLAFVEQWHDAAGQAGAADVPAAHRRLRGQLERPHLRELAASPLLCAMLCALNLAHRSELPRNRMDLYAKALAMLLHLRDAERGITGMLSDTGKRVLLRDLAWRLTLANRVELAHSKALEYLAHKLPGMPNVDTEPEPLLDHLLERSGVLRSPVPGKVDFVHRTFQEYLAADEAVQQHHIDTLIGHAHQDTWRETIVMACGHATARQAAELIGGILDRAAEQPAKARRFRLLAAACLETVHDVDPAVRARVDDAVERHLVPPRGLRETGSLASIGHRVLRYLPEELAGLSGAQAEATVRAAALTGSPEALPLLARYARDRRPPVQRQLEKSWQYFDPESFADTVLAGSPLDEGRITVRSRHLLPCTGRLRHLRSLWIFLPRHEPLDDLRLFAGQPHLTNLNGYCVATEPLDLAPLREHERLTRLTLRQPQRFTSLRTLSTLRELERIDLAPVLSWQSLDFLTELRGLTVAWLHNVSALPDLSALHALPRLEHVHMSSYSAAAISRTEPLAKVTELGLRRPLAPTDYPALVDTFPLVERLTLIDVDNADLRSMSAWPVRHLTLQHSEVPDLRPLATWPNLRTVLFHRLAGTPDLGPLADLDIELTLSRDDHYTGLDRLGPGVRIRYLGSG